MASRYREKPAYDNQLSGFHRVFQRELDAIIAELPLRPGMRVLDLACGDGFYTRLIASHLGGAGAVTGVDVNLAYLADAEADAKAAGPPGPVQLDFIAASVDQLPFPEHSFDLVWCAQSLYSLPDPVMAITHMARVVRPGGVVAVLENDTLHQVMLPWPVHLELPLRAAELQCFLERGTNWSKFYIGRRLPATLAAAGLEPGRMTTHGFDRQAPLTAPEHALMQAYLEQVSKRVTPYLDADLLTELQGLIDPHSPRHLLQHPHLSLTWLNVLALGRKPAT